MDLEDSGKEKSLQVRGKVVGLALGGGRRTGKELDRCCRQKRAGKGLG